MTFAVKCHRDYNKIRLAGMAGFNRSNLAPWKWLHLNNITEFVVRKPCTLEGILNWIQMIAGKSKTNLKGSRNYFGLLAECCSNSIEIFVPDFCI